MTFHFPVCLTPETQKKRLYDDPCDRDQYAAAEDWYKSGSISSRTPFCRTQRHRPYRRRLSYSSAYNDDRRSTTVPRNDDTGSHGSSRDSSLTQQSPNRHNFSSLLTGHPDNRRAQNEQPRRHDESTATTAASSSSSSEPESYSLSNPAPFHILRSSMRPPAAERNQPRTVSPFSARLSGSSLTEREILGMLSPPTGPNQVGGTHQDFSPPDINDVPDDEDEEEGEVQREGSSRSLHSNLVSNLRRSHHARQANREHDLLEWGPPLDVTDNDSTSRSPFFNATVSNFSHVPQNDTARHRQSRPPTVTVHTLLDDDEDKQGGETTLPRRHQDNENSSVRNDDEDLGRINAIDEHFPPPPPESHLDHQSRAHEQYLPFPFSDEVRSESALEQNLPDTRRFTRSPLSITPSPYEHYQQRPAGLQVMGSAGQNQSHVDLPAYLRRLSEEENVMSGDGRFMR